MNENSAAFELCIICNTPFVNLSRRLRKTCSSECARANRQRMRRLKEIRRAKRDRKLRPEKYKLKYKLMMEQRCAARGERSCRACGTDISGRHGKTQYCSKECLAKARTIPRTCRKCSEPIPSHRHLCDQCKSTPKPSRNWVRQAKTIDEQIRRRTIVRRNARKRTQLQRAAYSVYRQLIGEYGKMSSPNSANCLVCSIKLTGGRRTMCGSRSCHAAREKISRQLIAEGKKTTSRKPWPKLPTRPCSVCGTPTYSRLGICLTSQPCLRAYNKRRRLLTANGGGTGGSRFHPLPQPRQCIVCGDRLHLPRIRYCPACKKLAVLKKRQRQRHRCSRQRTRNETLVYIAMRELNLLPTTEDKP